MAAGIKTGFLPGKELFFTMRSQMKLYELYEVKSHREFMVKFSEKDKSPTGLEPSDFQNIIYAARLWEDKTLEIDDVLDDLDEYLLSGKGQDDLYFLLLDVFANSGMTDKNVVEAIKKARSMSPEKVDEYMNKIIEARLQTLSKGEDKGEPKKI
jgi:hypothetical protein